MSRTPRRRSLISAFAALMMASPLAAIVPSTTVQAAEPDGPRVEVDPADDLDPEGETVTVSGTGFDTSDGKQIYVMFCAQAEGEAGTPEGRPETDDCSGFGDGAWIGHGAPADPLWGPGGSFEIEATARAEFGDVDCLDPDTVCGFITRADAHGDQGFFGNDTFTPVTFAGEADGPRVEVDPADDLDPEGETVTVSGTGFDTSGGKGIYVQFCAAAEGEPGTPEGRPGGSGCSGAQAWIGEDFRAPDDWIDADEGSFEIELEAVAEFGDVDCFDPDTVCGFATRGDHEGAGFFGNDTFTPVTFAEAPADGPHVTVSPRRDLDSAGETVTVTGTGFDTSGGKGIYVRFCARADGDLGTPEGRPEATDCNGTGPGEGAWIGHGPPSDPLWDGDGFELELEAIARFGDVDCLDPDTVCGFATQSDHQSLGFFGNDTFTPVTFADDGTGPVDPGPADPDPGGPGTDPGQQQGDRRATVTPTTGLDASGDRVRVKGSGYPTSVGVYVRLCEAPGGRVGTMGGRPANCDGQGTWVTTQQTGPGTAPVRGGAFDLQLPVAGAFTGETAKIDCMQPGSCGIFIRRDHFGPTDTTYDAWFPIAFADDTEAPEVDEPLPPSLNDVVLEVTPTDDVDDGATLSVKGSKYAPGRGVYVQFCAAPDGQLGTAAGRPTRCYPGQDGTHTVWVSPIAADGTFSTNVVAEKTFTTDDGEEIDCSEPESCGVVTRRDHDGGASDHSQDAFVPVTFGDGVAAPRGAGTITADRTAGLNAAGDTITVTGEGFRPNTAYAMTVCATDGFTCDYGNVTEMTTDGDGGFREPLTVQGAFPGAECGAAGCEVNTWAVSMSTPDDEATLPVGFVGSPLPRTGSDPVPMTLAGFGLLALGGAAVGAGRRRRGAGAA